LAFGQGVSVSLAPTPQFMQFDQSGRPLAFGCVFTYATGTTTQIPTYTDVTGITQNQNPVILTAGGTANIWVQSGIAYTFKVKSAGGVQCASGATLYTVNGIGGGASSLVTVVAFNTTLTFQDASQNQLFTLTLTGNASSLPLTAIGVSPPGIITWQITQDAVGNRTFAWPSNVIGGCTIAGGANQVSTQMFIWNGTNATAIGPCVTGTGPALNIGSLLATGAVIANSFTSGNPNPALSGSVRLASADWITWRNNANSGDVILAKNAADNLIYPNGLSLGGGTALATTNQSGTGNICMTTNCQLVTPALNGVTVSGTPAAGQGIVATSPTAASWGNIGSFNAPQRVVLGSPVALPINTQTIVLTESVTFPSTAGTYRADVRYGAWATVGANICSAEVIDTTNSRAWALSGQNPNGSGFVGLSGSEISSQTYAAGATATFTLQLACNAASTATINGSFSFSPQEPTYLSVTPVLSN
jgi:hypothetical protein